MKLAATPMIATDRTSPKISSSGCWRAAPDECQQMRAKALAAAYILTYILK
jgi:hypothetical protein